MRAIIIPLTVIGLLVVLVLVRTLPAKTIRGSASASVSPSLSVTPSPTPLSTPSALVAPSIGHITRHAEQYIGMTIRMQGYVLASEKGYVIFSDESTGAINPYDLPVIGPGITGLKMKQQYTFEGVFVLGGLVTSNHSATHLELSSPPTPTTP